MAFHNRAKMGTATTGTGTLTLGGAEDGFASFAEAGVANGETVTYTIEDGNDFEVGRGVYTSVGTQLTRASVLLSKISGVAGTSKIDLSGTASVFVTAAAEDIVAVADIGTTVQAWDAQLDEWATVDPSENGKSLVSAADYADMRALLDLEAGTDFYSIAAAEAAFLTPAEGNAAYQPLDADLTSIAALATTTYGRSLLTLADDDALAAEISEFYQPLDADLTTLGAGGTGARDFLDLGAGDSVLFNSVTTGTADAGNVDEVYALSDEGNYTGIIHTLSDDYNKLVRITRVSSSDGNHVPMDIALASRGTLDSPSPMQAGDRSWAIAAAGRAANGTWQRLGYQWFEVKSAPSGDVIPGMYVLRVTKPGDYFPRDILRADWTDGVRHSAHAGFDGIIDQTDAATITWNVTQAQVAEVTLGGNRTLLPSGMKDGFEYDFYVSADGSARILSLSNSGGLEWYLRGSDGILYTQTSPIALPASGFAHIKMVYGGGAFIGTVTLITGHPQRAVVPSVQFTSLATNRAGANNNSAQAVFASTEDTLTVEGSTSYRFEAVYSFTRSAGTTAHRTNVLFGGTATFTSIGYHVVSSSTEADFGGGLPYAFGLHSNVATAFDIFGADTNDAVETVTVKLSGIMRINAAGTIIPQIQYSAAPGGAPTFLAGSYFEAWPIGSNSVVSVGDFS